MRHLYNTRNIFFTLFLLCCTTISAYDFESDGIFYNILSKTEKRVEVTHGNYNEPYKGSLIIPATVTQSGTTYSVASIEPETFWGCTTLTGITIPESITAIGNHAFYGCTALTDIALPHSITTIGNAAFCGCARLASITIPQGVTTIGNEAFAHCSNLKDIVLPTSITAIGEKAFKHCSALEEITIPQEVTAIGASMFEFCTALESITIPQGITTIGNEAFWGCSALKNIIIPGEVTSIGTSAFDGCTALKEIHIPENVASIGNNAFNACNRLEKITVASGNTTYDSRNKCNAIIESATNSLIQGCSNTIIPEGVNTIHDWAFYGSDNLASATIPEGTTSIGDWAFYNCTALTGIEIPNSTENIGTGSFYGCEALYAIYSQSSTPALVDHYTFDGLYTTATLYIPADTKEQYESRDYWSKFANIVELPGGPRGDANSDGIVDIADVTATTAMIIAPHTATPAGDVDNNGIVDTEDIAGIIETIQTTPAQATTPPTNSTTVECDGEGNSLFINIANPQYPFSAIQFDLHIPTGIEVEKENGILTGSRACASHTTPECTLQPNGAMRVIIHSTENENFSGTSGDIAIIALKAEGIADRSYPFELKNIKISSNGTKEELNDHTGHIIVTNGTVGISTITTDNGCKDANTIYDMSGRKVTLPIKGSIYIKGGKKHIAQ